MGCRGKKKRGDERAVSTVVGAALVITIVVLLAATAVAMTVSLGQSKLSAAEVQGVGQYDFNIETISGDTLVIRPKAVSDLGSDIQFSVFINNERVATWNGTGPIKVKCLYPGDEVLLRSEAGRESDVIQEHYFDRTTNCSGFNSFPDKFQHVKVKEPSESSYDVYEVNKRYAFGLAIDPNGDQTASDPNGNHDLNLGSIPLSNKWHYVKQYDREVEGLDPPVFVVVMVDNVHWTAIPDPSAHGSVSPGTYYNWTDDPPSSLNIGENAVSVDGNGNVQTDSSTSTEPTNDIYLVFKPGCDRSKFKFVAESAGYDNEIYLDGTKIIGNTNTATKDKTFTAPGVQCRGDTNWDD